MNASGASLGWMILVGQYPRVILGSVWSSELWVFISQQETSWPREEHGFPNAPVSCLKLHSWCWQFLCPWGKGIFHTMSASLGRCVGPLGLSRWPQNWAAISCPSNFWKGSSLYGVISGFKLCPYGFSDSKPRCVLCCLMTSQLFTQKISSWLTLTSKKENKDSFGILVSGDNLGAEFEAGHDNHSMLPNHSSNKQSASNINWC